MCLNLQREVYPLLLLFPAERKNNTVSYEGDIAVSDIIKFLAAHGSHVVDLIVNKGKFCKVMVLCFFLFLTKMAWIEFPFSFDFSDTFGIIWISFSVHKF